MDGEGIQDLQEWLRARGVAAGYVKPSKEEQEQMAEAQENQQPDPQAVYLENAAAKEAALAGKAEADTELSRANTEKALADAEKTRMETREGAAEKRIGVLDRVRGLFSPQRGAR
jgi:hypothetical protein